MLFFKMVIQKVKIVNQNDEPFEKRNLMNSKKDNVIYAKKNIEASKI